MRLPLPSDRDVLQRDLYEWRRLSVTGEIEKLLRTIDSKEARVLRARYGIETGKKATLQEIADSIGVTRERIRQIEKKALRKSRHPTRSRHLRMALGAEFVRTKGALMISRKTVTPYYRLLTDVLEPGKQRCHELGHEFVIWQMVPAIEEYLSTIDGTESSKVMPSFLSAADASRLRQVVEERKERAKESWTRPRMAYEALRILGRPAHYTEIAETCNELFPHRAKPSNQFLSILSSDSAKELGIVWLGSRGMYGLEEHGYQRPEADLYAQAAQAVKEIFGMTGNPVSEAQVINEMRRLRAIVVDTSIKMALSFNEQLSSVGNGRYVPKGVQPETESPAYDISAAFDAFTSGGDKE